MTDPPIDQTMSADQAASPTQVRPVPVPPTLDLRMTEAQWTLRRLQARVRQARRQLAEAEAARPASERSSADATGTEAEVPSFGAPLTSASELIAEEWGETSRTIRAVIDAADAEVRRLAETAVAEARILEAEAARLRALPVTTPAVVTANEQPSSAGPGDHDATRDR